MTNWLKEYKFKNWSTHRTHGPGTVVTPEQKKAQAGEIADKLCDHSKWLSHGRSVKIPDLEGIGLEITDYSRDAKFADAIRRYHVLLQMTFDSTGVYKLYETPSSQIQRFLPQLPIGIPGFAQRLPVVPGKPGVPGGSAPMGALLPFRCSKCKKNYMLQADFEGQRALQSGAERFPLNDILVCSQCGMSHNLVAMRRQLELQTRRKVAR
ncbi:MAG: hypothetical protein WBQ43_10075 [Terriglobales bacterium]